MKAVERLLNEALTWEGYCEKKNASNLGDNTPQGKIVNAGSNNYTIFGKHLLDTTGAKDVYGIDYQWCDQFVDDMMVRTFGVEMAKLLLGGWSAYTPTSASYYKRMNQWFSKPQVGDQIFFRNSERIHHTGLVIGVTSTTVKTIEGNTSAGKNVVSNGGKVAIKTYNLFDGAIAGYGRPNYALVDGGVPDVTYPCWVKSGNDWYYRIAEGQNAHGWMDIKNADGKTRRYYFDDKGKMLTGWQQLDNNYWFFFHDTKGSSLEGAMYVSDKDGRQFIATF